MKASYRRVEAVHGVGCGNGPCFASSDAGIRVVMITGDNKDTAEAVADLVHIREGFDKSFPSYTGKEFEALSASEKMKVLSSRKLFKNVGAS